MFAGLIPVFWIMVCMLVAAYWQAVKYGYPKRADGSSMVERFPGLGRGAAHLHRVDARA